MVILSSISHSLITTVTKLNWSDNELSIYTERALSDEERQELVAFFATKFKLLLKDSYESYQEVVVDETTVCEGCERFVFVENV
jgi:hypothetical protein